VRQMLKAYNTRKHGPVYAWQAASKHVARVITWRDTMELVHHSDLNPFHDLSEEGVVEVMHLQKRVDEVMSPHKDGRVLKYSPMNRVGIGNRIFDGPIHKLRWQNSQHVRNVEYVDISGIGRYLVRRVHKGSRVFRAYLNNVPTSFMGDMPEVKSMVERSVRAAHMNAK
jgi:hypothetical protein